ncbi:hypothetical protein GDO78_015596 [Eleutherodactylus coqui]|uniref:Uncharacterized protein n=1 Tax=Eleutherodactylus coqui TaxID=57060 RepID=A0A8J6EQC2_ELECQ|nr:hypothetical protein GDO78_015596 [Eleutherodactylus coqui]
MYSESTDNERVYWKMPLLSWQDDRASKVLQRKEKFRSPFFSGLYGISLYQVYYNPYKPTIWWNDNNGEDVTFNLPYIFFSIEVEIQAVASVPITVLKEFSVQKLPKVTTSEIRLMMLHCNIPKYVVLCIGVQYILQTCLVIAFF